MSGKKQNNLLAQMKSVLDQLMQSQWRQIPGDDATDRFHSTPYLHLLKHFLSGKDDYELLRAWHSASIAAKAITCCDRDKEASSSCRRLIDWAVSKREMSFTMGSEGQQAQDTLTLFRELCILLNESSALTPKNRKLLSDKMDAGMLDS